MVHMGFDLAYVEWRQLVTRHCETIERVWRNVKRQTELEWQALG